MIRIRFIGAAILAAFIFFAERSSSADDWSLADQSSYRCPGGLVAVGDSNRSVRDVCGDPLEITSRDDKGPIWIYHFGQERFMYYFEFVFGKLERILSAPCNRAKYDCFNPIDRR